jgi:hypothetical protein
MLHVGARGRAKGMNRMLVENVSDQLVVEVARGVVREVAPQEMPLFRANSDLYFKDPSKALSGATSGDQLLGFGTGVEVTLLTPVVLSVVSLVIKALTAELAKSVAHEGAVAIDERVKRLFIRFRTDARADEPQPLTPSQLQRIRTMAYDEACRLHLSQDEARLLADSTVGGLVVAA